MLLRIASLTLIAVCHTYPQEPAATNARERWNRVFADPQSQINRRPNAFLQKVVAGWKPGTALDVGIGMGRNSLWLASRGWDVTGIDVSDAGIKLAQASAEKEGLRLKTSVVSADNFDYGRQQYDLIIGIFMHQIFSRNADKLIAALKPGGTVLVEAYHADTSKIVKRPLGYESNELLRAFDKLRIKYYEELMGNADYSPERLSPLVRMLAVRE